MSAKDSLFQREVLERGVQFTSTKTFGHNEGLSCCFRQWRAEHSHCKLLHGYAISVKLIFKGPLDERNWVADFGGFKSTKEWLKQMFDHTTIIALDDPAGEAFQQLHDLGLIRLVRMPAVGCEAFAYYIMKTLINGVLPEELRNRLAMVEVREHEGNSAACWRGNINA